MEEGFLFKEIYNKQLVEKLAENIHSKWRNFNSSSFINSIVPNLTPLSLSERSQLITTELYNHLPKSYSNSITILLESFEADPIEFSFEIESLSDKKQNLMIDFIVHYMKSNGKLAPKVFKLSKKSVSANGCLSFKKKISFKPITTRKYYLGQHEIEIQINGKRYGKVEFVVE